MGISLIFGLVFSPLAALMAWLITYGEYRHHYPDRGPAIREATKVALFTLVVFLLISALIGWLLTHYIVQ